MIKSLTRKQKARMFEYVEKYTELGLSTKPVSKERTEEIINQFYEIGGVEKPKIIIHVDSPLAIFYTYSILEELEKQGILNNNVKNNVRNTIENSIWNNIGINVLNSVNTEVRKSIEDNIRRNVWNNVEDNIRRNVLNSIENNTIKNVWDNVEIDIKKNIENNVLENIKNNIDDGIFTSIWNNILINVFENSWNNILSNIESNVKREVENNVVNHILNNILNDVYSGLIFGNHYAGWLSFYAFVLNELKLKIDKINGLLNTIEIGWFYAGKDICIVSSKPSEIYLNSYGKLHNEFDMAIKYPDGYGLYAWHGIIIDWNKSWIITNPEKISLDSINKEQNAEIRRVMIERFTFERYIKESKAKPIDESKWGQLFSLDIGLPEPVKLVYVTNSTPEPDGTYKKYMIPVPPHINTCLEGLTWSFEGITEEEYSNMILET